MLRVGSRVSVAATSFDLKNDNSWSFSEFGDQWRSARCYGIVKNLVKSQNKATVLWDIDGNCTKISTFALKIENQEDTVNDVLERSEVSESDSSSSDSGSCSSSENGLENENDFDIRNTENNHDEEVQAHDTTWKFNSIVTINSFKDGQYRPQIHVRNLQEMKELDFWLAFFPIEEIDHILQCTNANIREKRKAISKDEFMKAIGILYAMTLNFHHNRRDFWSTEERGLFPAPAFGKRFGMGVHRFEEILNCMAFVMPTDDVSNDRWYEVRPFFEMACTKWRDIFTPGYKLTVDESMFAWYGKGLYKQKDGMPAVIKIKRKPKGVGCECKTLADVQSGIMMGIEINEGKHAMQEKEWQRDLGAGTATALRLTKPWHGSGRIVIGDSWFGSVKTAVELRKRGLYFMGVTSLRL